MKTFISRKQRAFDKRMHVELAKHKAAKEHQQHSDLAEIGKGQAHRDMKSCDKARSWRMRGDFSVAMSRVRKSKIDWT
jgi:hypothetical protein